MSSLKTSNLSTNKFKVGDEVEIVSLQGTDGIGERGECEVVIGSKGKIIAINNDYGDMPYYVRNDDGEDWYWSENNLKLVDETNASQNESIKKSIESKPYNPLVAQEGGGHYKNRGIQPIEYSHANSLSASQHSIVKYITRYYDKGGIEDLSKIVHFVLLEAYFRYGEKGSTELKDKILTILGENKES